MTSHEPVRRIGREPAGPASPAGREREPRREAGRKHGREAGRKHGGEAGRKHGGEAGREPGRALGGGIAPASAEDAVSVRRRRPARDGAEEAVTLLLHGLAGSGGVWEPFAERAADRLELWAAELPWGGGGAWSRREDPGRWVTDALAATTAAAGRRPDVLIAHSFAATLTLALLADGVDLGGAVVLVAPFYRARPEDFGWDTIAYYLNDFHRILAEGIRVRAGTRLDEDLRADMALRVRERIGPYGWTRFFEAYLRTPGLDLGRVGTPVLIVAGQDDFAAFPTDAHALGDALPTARTHVLPDCGHFPMVERPEEFHRLVDDFLTAPDVAGDRPRPLAAS
jgi:pimeloyl-ACP methyl ester carboxylesterase